MKTVLVLSAALIVGSVTVNSKILVLEIPVLIIFGLLARYRARKKQISVTREMGFSYKDPWE